MYFIIYYILYFENLTESIVFCSVSLSKLSCENHKSLKNDFKKRFIAIR